jgi:Flp pilus assembly protein TadG
MIEFAIASGLMVTLVLGILTYGEVLAQYIQLRHAVGEMARRVAVGSDAASRHDIFDALKPKMIASFKTDTITAECVAFVIDQAAGTSPPREKISATYSLTSECRFMPAILPMPASLTTLQAFSLFPVPG